MGGKLRRKSDSVKSDEHNFIYSLPHLPPDLFDDFVTWVHERFDLESFKSSKIEFKKKELKKFMRSRTDAQLQYSLDL